MMTAPCQRTRQRPEASKQPMAAASTPRRAMRSVKASSLSGGTASVMRSWDSLIQICQGSRPGYFSGTRSSSTTHPPHSRAISATEHESPPAPLSVMLLYRPASRASLMMASENFFCVIGSPICTAVAGEPELRASDENVAP